jgi:hypothetical protein
LLICTRKCWLQHVGELPSRLISLFGALPCFVHRSHLVPFLDGVSIGAIEHRRFLDWLSSRVRDMDLAHTVRGHLCDLLLS